ncbi:pheST operon leader peptide PheM [Pectobacterium wasabiae]|nr:pheST operon leader peptide PheM [Pectobacterium wasabiae]
MNAAIFRFFSYFSA